MLEKWCEQASEVEGAFAGKLEKGILRYGEIEAEIWKQRIGQKAIEKCSYKTDAIKRKYRNYNTWFIVFYILLLAGYSYLFGFVKSQQVIYMVGGILILSYWLWGISQMLRLALRGKKAKKAEGLIVKYLQQYEDECQYLSNFYYVVYMMQSQSIEPMSWNMSYADISTLLEAKNFADQKSIKGAHFVMDVVIAAVVLAVICSHVYNII